MADPRLDLPEPWCSWHDLPRYICGCMDKLGGVRVNTLDVDWDYVAELAERGMTGPGTVFESRYDGTCPCGGSWSPGDLICWSREADHYVHARCADGEKEG